MPTELLILVRVVSQMSAIYVVTFVIGILWEVRSECLIQNVRVLFVPGDTVDVVFV